MLEILALAEPHVQSELVLNWDQLDADVGK